MAVHIMIVNNSHDVKIYLFSLVKADNEKMLSEEVVGMYNPIRIDLNCS